MADAEEQPKESRKRSKKTLESDGAKESTASAPEAEAASPQIIKSKKTTSEPAEEIKEQLKNSSKEKKAEEPASAASASPPQSKKKSKRKNEAPALQLDGLVTLDKKPIKLNATDDGLVVDFGDKTKKGEVFIIRWCYLVAVRSDLNEASKVEVHYVRKEDQTKFAAQTPTTPRSNDPNSFTVNKFPAFKLRHLLFTFENAPLAANWLSHLQSRLTAIGHGTFSHLLVPPESVSDQVLGSTVEKKHLLVYINPFSGKKTALKVWNSVKAVFELNNWKITEIITQKAGHCTEDITTKDLKGIDRIATVSGDGLMNELVNGLILRPDWAQALTIPLGVIPGGTGNALASALLSPSPLGCAMAILKGNTQLCDMLSVYQKDAAKDPWKLVGVGFLALMWALVSDIDIESENLRWMGSTRFVFGTVKRILALRRYPGHLLMLPHPDDQKVEVCQGPAIGCKYCSNKPFSIGGQENSSGAAGTSSKKSKKSQKAKLADFQGRPAGLPAVIVKDPLEDDEEKAKWVEVEGDFTYFVASNITHIASDVVAAPYAHFSDGAIDVAYSTELNDKMKLLGLFAGEVESGKYVRHPAIKYRKVKAFVLVPKEKAGIMDLDGEAREGKITAVETHSNVLTFCRWRC